MKPLLRTLAGFVVVAVSVCGVARPAQAAPIALQFDVNIDRLCDAQANCQDVSIDTTMTYLFDDTVVSSYGFDLSPYGIYSSTFAAPSLIFTGGLSDLPHLPGDETVTDSSSFLYRLEDRNPAGGVRALVDAKDNRTYDGTLTLPDGSTQTDHWQRSVEMLRNRYSPTEGDGIISSLTGADFIDELSIGSFLFTWSNILVTQMCDAGGVNCWSQTDPRSFYASGTATLAATAVPEPASLLLLGSGLLAGVGAVAKKAAGVEQSPCTDDGECHAPNGCSTSYRF